MVKGLGWLLVEVDGWESRLDRRWGFPKRGDTASLIFGNSQVPELRTGDQRGKKPYCFPHGPALL